MGTFLGTFTAHEILQLRSTMNQFVHTQNLLGHVTAKNQNEIRALQTAMEDLFKVIHILAESRPLLIQLALEDQMCVFEIETLYLWQNNDIVIILQVPCINVHDLMTIYRHLSFPIPLQKP